MSSTVVAIACSRDSAARAEQVTSSPRVQEVSDTSVVTVPHADRFALIPVESRPVPDRLSGTCMVSPDVNRTVPVNALGSGRVVELKATLGDQVRRGQVLVTINSPDVAAAQAERLRATADANLARKQLDRARLLFEHGSIARKELEAADDAEQKAQIDLQAAEERVRMLGGDPANAAPVIELRAPIAGTIIEQNVTPAAGVKSPDNAPNLFTIADLSRIWVLCDVYENDLAEAQVGHLARIRLNAYPGRVLAGRIGNVSRVLDPNTRTAKVRVELENSSGIMRPGMFATAELESPSPRERLVLPTTAIVQVHDANWAFVKVGATTFRRVPVQTAGEATPGQQVVVAGLSAGQQVVRDALQFIQTVEQ